MCNAPPCIMGGLARHLWSFSTLLMAQPQQWGFQPALVRRAADTAYAFMHDNMLEDAGEDELRTLAPALHSRQAACTPALQVASSAQIANLLWYAAIGRATRLVVLPTVSGLLTIRLYAR